MVIEKNSIDVPDYLNEDVFKDVVKNMINNDNFQIKNISFKMGSSPGDNYTSQIYQVKISYEGSNQNNVISVIIKSIPITEHTAIMLKFDVYGKEKYILNNVLPYFEDMLHAKFGAKCYHAFDDPVRTLFLEDLKAIGFRCADRENGLDEFHSKMILRKIGQFHAASMVLYKKNPELFRNYLQGAFNEETMSDELFTNIFYGNLVKLVDLASTWPGYESIVQKLKYIRENYNEIILKHVDTAQDKIKVLNHGDLWVNNFMFKYSAEKSKEPEDAIFVDYQDCFYASPGIDLNYFLNTSPQFNVLKDKREELISAYYQSFSSTLEQLGYEDIPSEQSIQNEIYLKEFFGFIGASAVFPIIAMDRKECHDNSIDAFSDKAIMKEKRDIMFSSKRFVETMKYSLKRFDRLKVFDFPK